LENQKDKNQIVPGGSLPAGHATGELVRTLFSMTSSQALNYIIDQENAAQLVPELSHVDFFWLIKKIGEDDALPVLKLASLEQWQYLLDLEIWQEYEIDLEQTSQWLGRLHLADPERLAKWLLDAGSGLAYYYLCKKIQVYVREEDDLPDIPEDYFTLDNVFFIRILDAEQEEMLRDLIKHLAAEDHIRYQSLMVNLGGVIPIEHEESLYRIRNMRLAEDGFLPFEEAMAIYAYRKPEALRAEKESAGESQPAPVKVRPEEETMLVPISPLLYAQRQNLLMEVSRNMDPLFLDRIRIEFAGLCNQIMAADNVRPDEFEILIKVCQKAAGYIHLGLEKLAGQDPALAEKILKENPLVSMFQVGFSRALELKWATERWVKKSWFKGVNLKPDFWGEEWGGTLNGLLQKKPRLYIGPSKTDAFKEFETGRELDDCGRLLQRLMVLDRLLESLAAKYTIYQSGIEKPFFVFHTLLFNLWSRKQLGLEPGFAPLTLEQVRDLFRLLRGESKQEPFEMTGFEEQFIKTFSAYAADFEPEPAAQLKETLRILWKKFNEEYEWVATAHLDGRYSKFILVKPSSDVVLH
jgi:hypothetical protein